jgi:isoleucyl-tRNA synthetase
MAQDASSLILSLRKKVNIRVRQPLQKVLIPVLNPDNAPQLEKVEDLIRAEVNVKGDPIPQRQRRVYQEKDQAQFYCSRQEAGPKMKAVSAALGNFSQEEIAKLEKEGPYYFDLLIKNP